MFCKNCGHEMAKDATSCPRCGTIVSSRSGNAMQDTRIQEYKNPQSKKRTKYYHIIIGIVAIVLGSFGVHKYLMGRRFIWVLYFIFCWTFIPLIIGIVEGICYLACSEETFEKKYLFKNAANSQ